MWELRATRLTATTATTMNESNVARERTINLGTDQRLIFRTVRCGEQRNNFGTSEVIHYRLFRKAHDSGEHCQVAEEKRGVF